MRMELNISKILALVWLIPLGVPFFLDDNPLISPVSNVTVALVISTISALMIFVFVFRLLGLRGSSLRARNSIKDINYAKFSKKVDFLIWVWFAVYLINIFGSGGVPLLWSILGDSRTYADFGLPTLGGLGNMLRAFILTSCYILYFHSSLHVSKKRRYLWIGVFLIISALFIENSRGAGVVLVLHPIAIHFLFYDLKISSLAKLLLISLFSVIFFGFLQVLRYSNGLDGIKDYARDSGFGDISLVQVLMIPALMYISMPVINTDLNVNSSEFLKFDPYFSLQGVIPTFVRDKIFEKGEYGLLVNDANNASGFFVPFVRDFGQLGAFIIVSIIMLFAAYCYVKARSGNLFYVLCYPPIFMSIALSFFSLYFTSLVVVLYPLLVIFLLRGGLNNNFKRNISWDFEYVQK